MQCWHAHGTAMQAASAGLCRGKRGMRLSGMQRAAACCLLLHAPMLACRDMPSETREAKAVQRVHEAWCRTRAHASVAEQCRCCAVRGVLVLVVFTEAACTWQRWAAAASVQPAAGLLRKSRRKMHTTMWDIISLGPTMRRTHSTTRTARGCPISRHSVSSA